MLSSKWLPGLRRSADLPPARPRLNLLLDESGGSIGSIESELAQRLAAAGLPLRPDGSACRIGGPADASLAAIAHWMHGQGIGGRWRDELLSVNDASDTPVGAIERAAVRPLGIATRAVHLVGYTGDGRLWVQQRALDKSTDPGRWDTLMGGLMAHGESVATTLARETWEEAGLVLDELGNAVRFGEVRVRRPVSDGYIDERIDCFAACVPDRLTPRNQDGEVERFECLDPPALCERLEQDLFTLEAALILALWLERRTPA